MTIAISGYNFEGPYANTDSINNQSGVYAILGLNGQNQWNVVDVGESAMLKNRIDTHDRKDCWTRQGYADLQAAVYYSGAMDRIRIEKEVRAQYNPPCGKR